MSDGSSLTQISECGSDQGGSVDPIESSSDTSEDNISDSESISSDRHSSIDIDPDDRKSPAVEQIAKDTGCCLYSGITALVVMVVLLGIILIVTGPVLGLSFPPLVRINPPVPPVDDNHLLSNQSELVNEGNYDYLDYPQTYHSTNDSTADSADFVDYNQEQEGQDGTQDGTQDGHGPVTTLNLTTSINETEDLANLSPEALRLNPKYVAYVPIPIKSDDEDEEYHPDDSAMEREDDGYDTDHYDEEVTPRSSSSRRRPQANVDKVILPILMVPAGSSSGESTKTSQGADSWRSNDFSDPPPRRFDDDETIEDHYEDHVKPSSSLRIPGLSRFRNRNRVRRPPPGIDLRMFGSLAPETRQHRPRLPNRNGPRDDYGRTTALSQRRIPPYHSRINKERVEGHDGPSLYIRPPPRPHSRNQQARFQAPHVWSTGQLERQRSAQPAPTRKPSYSYPRDAMSIQDIISYMTSLSHSKEEPSNNPTSSDTGKVVWSSDSYHQSGRSRVGQSWPNVLPAPPGMAADSRIDSVQLSRNSGVNPYSFKLDVYPIRDGVGSTRQAGNNNNNNRYPPTSPQNYRQQSQDYRAQYYARPPQSSVDSTGVIADNIDFGYKVRIPDEQRYTDGYPSRRPYEPNYRDELPVPLAYRPRPTPSRDETTTTKPKLVVHLNVFNNKDNGANTYRYVEDRHDQEDDYYSPSDVYRAVLRNNAAKRDHEGGDDSMMGGQSRVGYSQTDGSSSKNNGQSDNLYENHNMAAMPTDHYYRSLRRPSSQQSTGSVGNYRRNFYPADEAAEPLPIPMAVSTDNPAGVGQEESTVSTTNGPPTS